MGAVRWQMGMVLAAILLGMAVPAHSQFPGGAGTGRGGAGSKGGDGMRMGAGERQNKDQASSVQSLSAVVAYRLELLEEDLRLSPDQRAAWETYRDRVLRMAEDVARAARIAGTGEMTAPQRLDRLTDALRDRLTAMEDVNDAGKHLYAVLTPAQRQLADRRLAVAVLPLAGLDATTASGRAPGPRGQEEPSRGN